MTKPTVDTMNLSERYVPNWSTWEVLREVVSNAMDACPDATLREEGPDVVEITTRTIPSWHDLTIMGAGTKSEATDTIGQFGEGFKLAALACTRMGGTLSAQLPDCFLTFDLLTFDGFDQRVLHVIRQPGNHSSHCTVRIELPNVASHMHKILPDLLEGPIGTSAEDLKMMVYCRGIFITTIDELAIWNWNLASLKLNRDRDIPDAWDTASAVAAWLGKNLDASMASQIIDSPDSYEFKAINTYVYHLNRTAKDHLNTAVLARHGDKVCSMTGDSESDSRLAARGYTLFPSGGLADRLDIVHGGRLDFEERISAHGDVPEWLAKIQVRQESRSNKIKYDQPLREAYDDIETLCTWVEVELRQRELREHSQKRRDALMHGSYCNCSHGGTCNCGFEAIRDAHKSGASIYGSGVDDANS